MRKTATERIQRMECILNATEEKLNALESAIADLQAYQTEVKKLEAYYTSADWKKDFALDEAGKLPAGLKRGVLSEDGVYHALERNRELLALIGEER